MINQVEAAKSATGKVFWRLENAKALLLAGRVPLILFVSAAIALLEPVPGLAPKAHLFLATLFGAVALWMIAVVAEYIVGLLLLLSWVVLDIVPVKTALGGFSQDSWFFVIGALGIAAAIGNTPLLARAAHYMLRAIPVRCQRTYTLCLLAAGSVCGLLLPAGKARAAVAAPVSQAIARTAGFKPRSNGAAAISLAAFVGFSQMSFLFLTASEVCLIAWNFLPPATKADFGWLPWFLVALPAGLCVSATMFVAIRWLLPLSEDESRLLTQSARAVVDELGPMSRRERIALAIMVATVAGWVTASLHGISEAWIALAALLALLLLDVLDDSGFRKSLDWGQVLFYGVLNSVSLVATELKVDSWFMRLSDQLLRGFAGQPFAFLLVVFVLISLLRLGLRKSATAALFTVTLLPLSQIVGIHPGVLIVAAVMVSECFLLGYQDGPYQIAYSAGGFTHAQARKVLCAKYVATLLALAVCVPCWRFLGYIR